MQVGIVGMVWYGWHGMARRVIKRGRSTQRVSHETDKVTTQNTTNASEA